MYMTPNELHQHAVKVDTELARLWSLRAKLNQEWDNLKLSIAYAVGRNEVYYATKSRRETYKSMDELVEALGDKLADGLVPRYDAERCERYILRVEEIRAELSAIKDLEAPLNADFEEKKWQRFFLVTNQNGHIHASMSCHSCNIRTQFAWLPELSGLTEKDAVEAHGPHLCTHCFPTAPVEWTLGTQKEADPNQCPGSGTWDKVEGTQRTTGWSGTGRAQCSHCKQHVGTTSTGKLRKHKKEVR